MKNNMIGLFLLMAYSVPSIANVEPEWELGGGIEAHHAREYIQKMQKEQEEYEKMGNFFERSKQRKVFERLEYESTPGNLNFYLGHTYLDPKLYANACQNAQKFAHQLQTTVAPLLQSDEPIRRYALSDISKHAVPQCNACATLELKYRKGEKVDYIKAENSFYLLWPYTNVDAATFYKNACGDFYKQLSDERLAHIIEVTK